MILGKCKMDFYIDGFLYGIVKRRKMYNYFLDPVLQNLFFKAWNGTSFFVILFPFAKWVPFFTLVIFFLPNNGPSSGFFTRWNLSNRKHCEDYDLSVVFRDIISHRLSSVQVVYLIPVGLV